MRRDCLFNARRSGNTQAYTIGNFQACLLAGVLNRTYQLTRKAFADEFIIERRIERGEISGILGAGVALC